MVSKLAGRPISEAVRALWGHDGPYNDYGSFMRKRFGKRVQKISINSGAGCPHPGACAYCRVESFVPAYCFSGDDIEAQYLQGLEFFSRKAKDAAWLAYVQAYSTAFNDAGGFANLLERLLRLPDLAGLVLSTRPDLVDSASLARVAELAKSALPITVELGVQSLRDEALLHMNRGHDAACSRAAVHALAEYGLECGIHLIFGLPGDTFENLLAMVQEINALPLRFVKIHHLQVLKGTAYASLFERSPALFPFWSLADYEDFCVRFLCALRPDIVVERFVNESNPALVVHPKWDGARNYTISSRIRSKLTVAGLWQGVGLV